MKPGDTLGPYRVLDVLGAGGMGEVYRARDTQLKREVALKVLPADVSADPERLARFQRETEFLAGLNHPRIAQIHGAVEQGGGRWWTLSLLRRAPTSPSPVRPPSRPRPFARHPRCRPSPRW
jgi:serine/threonine protein kinase